MEKEFTSQEVREALKSPSRNKSLFSDKKTNVGEYLFLPNVFVLIIMIKLQYVVHDYSLDMVMPVYIRRSMTNLILRNTDVSF